ncbi:shikimate kinase [Microbacterium excoecariae]|uniref:shikimate kinase n=1 Tax=Microbacterium excoecariae TaxID=2715210 RepID=UPI00140865DA|nr:shikimate kinase [Microbacterium excoecariae]NHI17119.1 shikimate kinase [Microbacterium excoecariae]
MSERPAVVLIGPMGAGKSSIGRRIAKRLGLPFTDTDAMVVREYGPIADLFATRGEATFRAIEADAVRRALAGGGVVALGGGAVLAPETRSALGDHLVIHLTVDERTVASRIRGAKRPLLNAGDPLAEWRRIAAERAPVYAALAHVTYDTSQGPLRDVVERAAEWAAPRLHPAEESPESEHLP